MASRISSLRTSLSKTTETLMTEGAKIKSYGGPTIGTRTGGNYGSLPRPMPTKFFFLQEANLKWALAFGASAVFITSAFVPVWAMPFWRWHAKMLREVTEEFGPTRYGAGKQYYI
jgi:hypothetical protein